MLRIKRLSEVVGRRVYTDSGDLFGLVEEINMLENVGRWMQCNIASDYQTCRGRIQQGAQVVCLSMTTARNVHDGVVRNDDLLSQRI